jgi:hypothetical protein
MHEPRPADIELVGTQPIDLTWLIAEALHSALPSDPLLLEPSR